MLPSFITNIILVLTASILFFAQYYYIAAFVAFVPLFLLLERVSVKGAPLWGALYGLLSYSLYGFWLNNLMAVVFFGAVGICAAQWAVILTALKAIELAVSRLASGLFTRGKKDNKEDIARVITALLQCGALTAFEWVKTKGFLGVSYGNIGYSLYKAVYVIQIADFGGVFAVSFLLYMSSAAVSKIILLVALNGGATALKKSLKTIFTGSNENKKIGGDAFKGGALIILPAIFMGLLIASVIYSLFRVRVLDRRDGARREITICAVQNNSDPWKSDIDTYAMDVDNLITLSRDALKEDPSIKIVVWPETAVVPSIVQNYNKDTKRGKIVRNLLQFIDSQSAAFLIGNFHAVGGEYYNSAMLFFPKINTTPPRPVIYSKVHLVPFTETFPYGKYFPRFYKWLTDGDTHLWDAGSNRATFTLPIDSGGGDFIFSSPICFEDTFGADCREFYNNGARAFISLGNDSWGKSHRAQEYHLSMAAFRSVENHIPSVRATASGVTCAIDSAGRVIKKIEEFSRGYLICKIRY